MSQPKKKPVTTPAKPACIRCGAPGVVGDTRSGIWACEMCMKDVAALTNGADWAPPAYLLAVLKRDVAEWRGVSMLRRTAALRAVETANALLFAAEQLVDPRTPDDSAQRFAERVTSTHLHDSGYKELEKVARLKIIEYVENCWQDERMIEGSLKTLAILFPEFPVDEQLFRQAIDAWKHEDYMPKNPDGPGMWEAICELLRLPGPKAWKNKEPSIAAERRRWKKADTFNNYNVRTLILHPELAAELEDGPAFEGRASMCFRTDLIDRLKGPDDPQFREKYGALLMGDDPRFLQAMQTTYADIKEVGLQQRMADYERSRAAKGAPLGARGPNDTSMEEATRHLETRPLGFVASSAGIKKHRKPPERSIR